MFCLSQLKNLLTLMNIYVKQVALFKKKGGLIDFFFFQQNPKLLSDRSSKSVWQTITAKNTCKI